MNGCVILRIYQHVTDELGFMKWYSTWQICGTCM